MVNKVKIGVFGSGITLNQECEFSLKSNNNSNTLNFSNKEFSLDICLKDVVDLEDFYNLLNKKEKKLILHCTLNYEKKEHQGLRKVLLKKDTITTSLGGLRLEIDKEANENLLKIVTALKKKFGA